MCTECNLAFFLSPLKMGIVAASFAASIAALLILRKIKHASANKRLIFLYAHVFAFAFPFIFFLIFRGCQNYFSGCSQAKAITALVGLTALVAGVLALALAPVVLARRYTRKAMPIGRASRWSRFVEEHSKKLGIRKPSVHAINSARPEAFSVYFLKPRIFVSVGLFEVLGRREIEAVLLHELSHIRSRASVFKLSLHVARVLSPFAVLASFCGSQSVSREEDSADNYAANVQGTSRYIDSAKAKVTDYARKKKTGVVSE